MRAMNGVMRAVMVLSCGNAKTVITVMKSRDEEP
jgi:hypothetical protein